MNAISTYHCTAQAKSRGGELGGRMKRRDKGLWVTVLLLANAALILPMYVDGGATFYRWLFWHARLSQWILEKVT